MIAVEIACNLPETKRELYAVYLKMCKTLLDRLGGAIDVNPSNYRSILTLYII